MGENSSLPKICAENNAALFGSALIFDPLTAKGRGAAFKCKDALEESRKKPYHVAAVPATLGYKLQVFEGYVEGCRSEETPGDPPRFGEGDAKQCAVSLTRLTEGKYEARLVSEARFLRPAVWTVVKKK